MSDRYQVYQQGRSGSRAIVHDTRDKKNKLTLQGPDRFTVAESIAKALNDSDTETPIEDRVTSFMLYKGDIQQLSAHIAGEDSCLFDVDSDGFVTVFVAGKDALKL